MRYGEPMSARVGKTLRVAAPAPHPPRRELVAPDGYVPTHSPHYTSEDIYTFVPIDRNYNLDCKLLHFVLLFVPENYILFVRRDVHVEAALSLNRNECIVHRVYSNVAWMGSAGYEPLGLDITRTTYGACTRIQGARLAIRILLHSLHVACLRAHLFNHRNGCTFIGPL